MEQDQSSNEMNIKNICFVGAGHVGAPSATVLAFFNPALKINVVDISEALIRRWNSNSRHLPLNDEQGLCDLIRVTRDGTLPTLLWTDDDGAMERPGRKPNLVFSNDVRGGVKEADMVFVCVETPTRVKGEGAGMAADTGSLEKAVEDAARWAKEGVIVVLKSTVPVGMARRVREMISMIRPTLSFEVLSNPEFLAEGEAVKNLLEPDRVLIGSSMTSTGHAAALALADIYTTWIEPQKIQKISNTSAELAKLTANAMLAQRISSINTISAICERTGADIAEVRTALGSDSRIGAHFLQAGIGFGGSCFQKDVLNLVHLTTSLDLRDAGDYWLQVLQINRFQSRNFVQRIISRLDGSLADKKVAIFGWTFKKGTSDARETRSFHVVKELLNEAVKEITIFDPGCHLADIRAAIRPLGGLESGKPECSASNVAVHDNPYSACQEADAVLILTDWEQFRCLPDPERPTVANPKDHGEGDAPSSTSCTSLGHTASSGVGSMISKLSIRDNNEQGDSSTAFTGPLSLLKPELPCPGDCRDCNNKSSLPMSADVQVDWKRVSTKVKSPGWVFDGRNMVNVGEMQKLGFRVEAIGKASAWESDASEQRDMEAAFKLTGF